MNTDIPSENLNSEESKAPGLRVVVIGGVAAGASAAARARRLSESARIMVVERGPDVSFANCGLPYHIGGEIADRSRLAVQTPESLSRLLNVEVLTRTEATRIDRERKVVVVRDLAAGGTERELAYDKLILAPGAAPLRPPLPGIDDARILTLRNLQDMDRIKAAAATAARVLVIGAGFIGLEMAEQLKRIGKVVTLAEAADQVLPPLDPEIAAPVADALRSEGVDLVLGDAIAAFAPEGGALAASLKSGRKIVVELVVLAIGVKPEGGLAAAAGLELGARGTIKVDGFMRTSDPDIYAGGDAVESVDRLTGAPMNLPLGGPANRQGRVIADHIFRPGQARPYPGHVGTAVVRVFDLAAGLTGWSEKRLAAAGRAYRATVVTDYQHASYFPGAVPLTLKVLWSPEDGRVLGAQAVGADGVDKRLDVIATGLVGGLTIDDLAQLELAYAPPFGSARDVVNTAGFAAQNTRDGLLNPVTALPPERAVLDVRPVEVAKLSPVPGAIVIPFPELRGRLGGLDRAKPWVAVCALGKTSYFAARVLAHAGFDAVSLAGGLRVRGEAAPVAASHAAPTVSAPAVSPAAVELDCCGMACPGPLLRVKAASETLAPGQELAVTASDPGFARDVDAFARSNGFELLGVERAKGLVKARLRRPADAASAPVMDGPARRKGATVVVFSGEMDKVMASLVIANGAAAMGGAVTMFFTFWGINALRREHAVPVAGKSILDRMFGWMLPRGLGALPLSKMNFGGAGRRMMKYQMASKGLPNLPGLLGAARLAGVRMVVCTMSMEAMGIRAEELIDGVEFGGVADYLASAETSGANLFV
jgi:NADPH-dependent 2,4-dienoyl-CoA reductase/sulfur reductase-like enzyme/peroxiredoxin family protein/TusA-related sulfurtransferase/rhodanese-related sulfurtransferase